MGKQEEVHLLTRGKEVYSIQVLVTCRFNVVFAFGRFLLPFDRNPTDFLLLFLAVPVNQARCLFWN